MFYKWFFYSAFGVALVGIMLLVLGWIQLGLGKLCRGRKKAKLSVLEFFVDTFGQVYVAEKVALFGFLGYRYTHYATRDQSGRLILQEISDRPDDSLLKEIVTVRRGIRTRYIPRNNMIVVWSPEARDFNALAYAAHEAGHAFQVKEGYWAHKLWSKWWLTGPLSFLNIFIIVTLVLILAFDGNLQLAMMKLSASLWFMAFLYGAFVVLPMEYDATRRALTFFGDPLDKEVVWWVLRGPLTTYASGTVLGLSAVGYLLFWSSLKGRSHI